MPLMIISAFHYTPMSTKVGAIMIGFNEHMTDMSVLRFVDVIAQK